MNLKALLKNLTKSEKDTLLKLLKTEIMDETNRFKNGIYCPYCKSIHIVKEGKLNNHQRYKCKDCHHYFSQYNNTIFYTTKKEIDLWKQYIDLMFEFKSLKKISKELNICIQTSFKWRHKILTLINKLCMNDKLSGIVEIDETFIRESQKGNRNLNRLPRNKTHGKFSKIKNKRGLSSDQAGVLVAIDRNNNIISKFYGLGKITDTQIYNILHNKIDKNSILITDGYVPYKSFAFDENFEIKQCISGRPISKMYHINNCNSYHSYLKEFLKKFKGISTKYIDEYLAWFKFIKQKNDIGYLFNELMLR